MKNGFKIKVTTKRTDKLVHLNSTHIYTVNSYSYDKTKQLVPQITGYVYLTIHICDRNHIQISCSFVLFSGDIQTHNNLGRLVDVNKTDGTETAFRLYSLHLVQSVKYYSSDVERD